ncbi:MAG: ATP-binding cassette domain-containing protein [Bdellovibrionota bacterium]
MSGQSAIQVRSLVKSFRDGRDLVLKGIDLDFPQGELTYILGSSGAGKSVLLKHLLRLLIPDSGSISVMGQDISKFDSRALIQYRLQFGMLFQNSALFDDMTVFDNVAFPLREHTALPLSAIREKVESTLGTLGMLNGYDKFPNELSGGMRKRVGLARAIIREPKILLYDEPTTGLDPVTRTTVDELIEALKTRLRLTSIVISHDIPSALLLADNIAFLHEGKILFWGKPKAFKLAVEPAIRSFLDAERRTMRAFEV